MPRFDNPRGMFVWGLVALGLLLVAIGGIIALRATSGALGSLGRPAEPHISQEIVLERLRDVAKLVGSEMVLRDVVIYEQTRFRSTKRALLVATGKISAGINLRRTAVQIDSAARKVTVTFPPAEILSVEVLNVTTYDERAGLLNPFTADDRDLIQDRIRRQLREAARQSGILEHADRSAAKALQDFLKLDGYTVEIRRPLALQQPTG
ncbi:MAG: DUF4230 domain-containing protein [Gemmatimonadaceae bacterium]